MEDAESQFMLELPPKSQLLSSNLQRGIHNLWSCVPFNILPLETGYLVESREYSFNATNQNFFAMAGSVAKENYDIKNYFLNNQQLYSTASEMQ